MLFEKILLTRYFSNISQDSNTFKTLQRKYINLTSTGTKAQALLARRS
jgi:hypothetical protein